MAHARCKRCGCFREPVREPGLFDGPLPVPSVNDPLATAVRESQRREAAALRRGDTRTVGAERRLRYANTHQALWGVQ